MKRRQDGGQGLAALAAFALAAGLLACQAPQTVRTQSYAGPEAQGLDIRKVAVAPFRASPQYPRTERDMDPHTAARLAERFVAEALAERGVEVVPPGDVGAALGLGEDLGAELPPRRRVAEVAHEEFGVPALVIGTVHRMRERTGENLAAASPASVWFEVTMVQAPSAIRLWSGTFNETQQPLNENLLNARRYPGGGTRWLRAEELARWGAREVARELPSTLPGGRN